MIFKPSNVLLASFFASNFLDENNSRQQREFVSVRVFLPLKKRESFRIICAATFLCYLLVLGLLGQATDTKPQEIQVQQRSGICHLNLRISI